MAAKKTNTSNPSTGKKSIDDYPKRTVTYPLTVNGASQITVAVDGVGEAIIPAGMPVELPEPMALVVEERIKMEQANVVKARQLQQELAQQMME